MKFNILNKTQDKKEGDTGMNTRSFLEDNPDIAAGTNAEIDVRTNIIGDTVVSFPLLYPDWCILQKAEVWKSLCEFLEEAQTRNNPNYLPDFQGLMEAEHYRSHAGKLDSNACERANPREKAIFRKDNGLFRFLKKHR